VRFKQHLDYAKFAPKSSYNNNPLLQCSRLLFLETQQKVAGKLRWMLQAFFSGCDSPLHCLSPNASTQGWMLHPYPGHPTKLTGNIEQVFL